MKRQKTQKPRNFQAILLSFVAASVITSGVTHGQGKTTIIKKVDGKVVDVEMVEKTVPYAFNSFAETDANQDGRIDQQEARNAGILAFRTADRDQNGWLDEVEYRAAASASDTAPTE